MKTEHETETVQNLIRGMDDEELDIALKTAKEEKKRRGRDGRKASTGRGV